MLPGRYEDAIRKWEQQQVFEVPLGGLEGLALKVGAMTLIEVKVLSPDGTAAPPGALLSNGVAQPLWNGLEAIGNSEPLRQREGRVCR